MKPISPISRISARSSTRVASRSRKPGATRPVAKRRACSASVARSSSMYGFIAVVLLRLLGVLAELGLAPFLQGRDALARLFGVVVQLERVHAQARDAGLVRRVGVEAALGDGQRGGAALADFLGPLLHLGVELLVRHHGVGQAHGHGLGAAVAAVQVPDLARLLLADHAGQEGSAVARVDRAHLRADLAEHGFLGGNGQVADGAQHVAAADGKALHARDDGLGHVADGVVQLFHRQADGAAPVVVAVVGRLVAAGAEGLLAGAGQHNGAHAAVVARAVERADDLVAGLAAEGVHPCTLR
eukprot:Opistho-2@28154